MRALETDERWPELLRQGVASSGGSSEGGVSCDAQEKRRTIRKIVCEIILGRLVEPDRQGVRECVMAAGLAFTKHYGLEDIIRILARGDDVNVAKAPKS